MDSAPGLTTGTVVEIYYTGIVSGTDTSNVAVIRVVQSGSTSRAGSASAGIPN